MKCERCPVAPGSPCVVETSPEFRGLYCGDWAGGTEAQRRMISLRSAMPAPDRRPAPPDAGPPAPGVLARVARFAVAAAGHAAAGFPTLGADEVERRLSVCRSCPSLSGGTCSLCGCNLALKAAWADQRCPEGKW